MIRLLLISILTGLVFVTTPPQPANAWVILGVIPKGQIPAQFPESVSLLLKKVLPIRGEAIDGFPHYQCQLYYRGTQQDVQGLLDGLGAVDGINLFVNVDRSGNVGRLESRPAFPLQRPLAYLYRVDMQRVDRIDIGFEQTKPKFVITVTIFSAGGIDPDQLNIPAGSTTVRVMGAEGGGSEGLRRKVPKPILPGPPANH